MGSVDLYVNNLKNWEFEGEASQNFQAQARRSGRLLPNRQGASESENFEKKPTLQKTDSPSYFGISNPLLVIGEALEGSFRQLKNFPQYKYFTRPLYKNLIDKVGSVAATGITFVVTDMTVHQVLPKISGCISSYIFPSFITESTAGYYLGMGEGACDVGLYSTASAVFWMTTGALVAYTKYKRG